MPFDSATAFRRQRREDERDKRLRDGPWADLQTRYHQWHRDGHEECRVYGQQRHKRDCEAEVGAGAFHEPWQERFTCLATKQNGADRVWALGGMTMLRTSAKTGAATKSNTSATKTSRKFRNGARIAFGVRLSPAASMRLGSKRPALKRH
jgi:hypothetical protein